MTSWDTNETIDTDMPLEWISASGRIQVRLLSLNMTDLDTEQLNVLSYGLSRMLPWLHPELLRSSPQLLRALGFHPSSATATTAKP